MVQLRFLAGTAEMDTEVVRDLVLSRPPVRLQFTLTAVLDNS